MNRCESCGNSRIVVSENGFHPVCTLSEKKAVDCLVGEKDYYDGQVKELSKRLCEESSCHHKCHDTECCVIEDEAKVIIGEWKFDDKICDEMWNDDIYKTITIESDPIDEETYEHMLYLARMQELWDIIYNANPHLQYCVAGGIDCITYLTRILLKAGYVRQSEGEWIHDINNLYGCSNCLGRETMSPKKLKPFCPNCGAKMKGGEKQ